VRRSIAYLLVALLLAAPWPTASAPLAPSPALARQENPIPTGFVQASGGALVVQGQPITLRGINYYPQGKPWADMWHHWDGPQIAHELRLARDELGINVVRVLIPFGWADWDKSVDDYQIDQLRQLSSIAGELNLRLILTLFDFDDQFEGPPSTSWDRQQRYLRTIVGSMAGDERVLAWDLHNEPDHYATWQRGGAQKVLKWLGDIAAEVRALDPNHLITVGMGQYDNLWQPGPDGRRVIDYSDLVSVHIYNAADAVRQLDELHSYTDKPILLEEFGWPSGPACAVAGFSEQGQLETYRQLLEAAQGRTVGTVAWTLRDYDPGPSMRWDTHQEHYGLYRSDGSLKPAAELFRAYAVPPLPSSGPTGHPLTTRPPADDGGSRAPIRVVEGGPFIKSHFRRAWELLDGPATFGAPLSEAYERYEDQRVQQFFEGTVLEYHPEVERAPDWKQLSREQQLMRQIVPASVGRYHAEQRGYGQAEYPIQGAFADFYHTHYGPWRLGPALSPELTEPVRGVETLVQYFERGRLEWDASTSSVRVGRLGEEAWRHQCAVTGW
jgi:hypothetical protein